jgi:cell wall-associated NlpC family hydrolase
LSSLFVRKLRNRQPSQFNPDTAGPAAAPAVPSGTTGTTGTTGTSTAGPLARHTRPVRALLMRGALAALSALLVAGVLVPLASSPASASTKPRIAALRWAESQAGKWYCFGGTGGCFDCSGLVMEAYAHAGMSIPRTTYGMLASSRLRQIPAGKRKRGDLAFYGSGHVELVTARGTFGAEAPGTQVGWHHPSAWWHPTMYFRVNGANR